MRAAQAYFPLLPKRKCKLSFSYDLHLLPRGGEGEEHTFCPSDVWLDFTDIYVNIILSQWCIVGFNSFNYSMLGWSCKQFYSKMSPYIFMAILWLPWPSHKSHSYRNTARQSSHSCMLAACHSWATSSSVNVTPSDSSWAKDETTWVKMLYIVEIVPYKIVTG